MKKITSIFVEHYAYKDEQILKNISFSLHEKKILCILGPSGCGKSTLLRILMGFEKGASGFVETSEKKSLQKWSNKQEVFGLVPQTPHLFPWKTVEENLSLAVSPDVDKQQKKVMVQSSIESIGLTMQKNKYPAEISVGMASRVSFARALLQGAPALLLDEPFAALDAHMRYQMQIWFIDQFKDKMLTALLVTHDVREALSVADQIIVLGGKPASVVLKIDTEHKSKKRDEWLQSREFFAAEKKLLAALMGAETE